MNTTANHKMGKIDDLNKVHDYDDIRSDDYNTNRDNKAKQYSNRKSSYNA